MSPFNDNRHTTLKGECVYDYKQFQQKSFGVFQMHYVIWGYTDSTIGLRQRYWKEYCCYHGSLDIDEASMDEFLLENYGIQSGNINISKRQYEARAALRNLLEYRRYGKNQELSYAVV